MLDLLFPMCWHLGLHAHMLDIMSLAMPCLDLHVDVYVSMPTCLDLCFHMPMCLDLCSLHALYYLPCVCALHAMFVCLDLGYVCHAMCYCSHFFFCRIFLCFGLLVRTLSKPYSLCHPPYTLAHIKGFGSPLFAMSMLACFHALCLC